MGVPSGRFEQFVQKYGRLPTEIDPDYLEMLNMSKYNIQDVPKFKPGKCANCGGTKNDGRKYIDFSLEIDWYGIVYLCTLCLMDVAVAAGLFDELKNKIDVLENRNAELLSKIVNEEEITKRVGDTLADFKELYEQYFGSKLPIAPYSPPEPGPDPVSVEAEKSGSDTSGDESGTEGAKPRTTKSSSRERPTDVPSLTELMGLSDIGGTASKRR